ncbi:hypothetical protein CRG98_037059 [Punica granatum]|uniref:Uncharacterized protein n=1 Tax=Punica granatum TaxID=22663 RepID=A0A2I0IEV8_PUNGR|nr:hypothetical protein CRG98_037059 [Punica granatum]
MVKMKGGKGREGGGGRGPTRLGAPTPALTPLVRCPESSHLARGVEEKRGKRQVGGPTQPGATPPALDSSDERWLSLPRGQGRAGQPLRRGKGGPTPLGALPPALKHSGESTTSPKGSRSAREPLVGSGPPSPLPPVFYQKTGDGGPDPSMGLPRWPSIPPTRWSDLGHLA